MKPCQALLNKALQPMGEEARRVKNPKWVTKGQKPEPIKFQSSHQLQEAYQRRKEKGNLKKQ
jgi:hypothetical protein